MEEFSHYTQQLNQYQELALQYVTQYGAKLLLALLTLLVGLWLIGKLGRMLERGMDRARVEKSLAIFLNKLASVLLKVLLLISVASMVGIETTSFIAIFGAAGLAVGLALQGSLANFAGGVMILMFKPFKVGDYIEAQGFGGTVHEIQIFNTILHSVDRKTIIIPNGNLSNGNIVNYSASPIRRVDFVFGVGYGDDLRQVRAVLEDILAADSRVLKDPESLVAVSALADSSVNFTVRAWVNAADYWPFYFATMEKVKLTFDERGISIPFPQRDVHLHQAAG